MASGITFTLDLEDHRAPGATEDHYPAVTRQVLAFLATRGIRGTFFVTGEVAEEAPDLIRDVADGGHELGFHGWRHLPLTSLTPVQLRADAKRGKALLEDASQTPVVGFRAPLFSLVTESRWAVDVLSEVGFTYSSSVLPARSPLFGDAAAPNAPFRWPSGLVELPCPVARVRALGLPYLGGVYLRVLPRPLPDIARAACGSGQLLWLYCHPYDFDVEEAFWIAPELGNLGSRLLWYNRRHMFAKVAATMRGRIAPPLAERVAALDDERLPEWAGS